MSVRSWLKARLSAFLSAPIGHYEQRGRNHMGRLLSRIRTGDVLLVEGDQRASVVIKFLTQSSWSHAAIYIGDELLRRGGAQREKALAEFGEEANHLVVEALFEGVIVAPISKYIDFNLRLCRANRLHDDHLEIILDEAVAAIGWRYDLRNILDLALHLLLASLFPSRYRGKGLRFGSGASSHVICTSLLGHLFHRVRFPVLPVVTFPEGVEAVQDPPPRSLGTLFRRKSEPHRGVFRQRHPTLLTPRDFDLSPYFEVVKFNVIEDRDFDYGRIEWADDDLEEIA